MPDDSRKVSSPFLTLLFKLQKLANQCEVQRCFPPFHMLAVQRNTCCYSKGRPAHVIHPVTPGFDGLSSPLFSSRCMTWAGTADVHFPRMALPVAGLLYSLSAALLHLLGEQPLSGPRVIFFQWYRQKVRPLTWTLKGHQKNGRHILPQAGNSTLIPYLSLITLPLSQQG